MPDYTGALRKMQVQLPRDPSLPVNYSLVLDEQLVPLNAVLGQRLSLHHSGTINCIYCGRTTKKSFNQGYCYPCFKKLARCDQCIVSPEKCHYHLGTCREPEWGDQFCMQDHYVYLANSSGLKVGITRGTQIPTRWIDQGAVQALPIYRVQTRRQAGLVEMLLKAHVADKTNWRAMLQGEPEALDLHCCAVDLCSLVQDEVALLQNEYGLQAITRLVDAEQVGILYPVQQYPEKIRSHNFDKEPLVQGVMQGIKGQYLLLDSGVINLRKFGGYQLTVST
ncbi:MAG: DUF2797 domain-containing protein, partial [Pseudomonadales bacterium]|nr:DUF2797 domain-containing protein [Pseudomonadales bacterium]